MTDAALDRGGVFEARRAALTAEWGHPVPAGATAACRLLGGAAAGLNPSEVLAMRYRSRDAATAFHRLAAAQFGHVSLGIAADPGGDGWLGVLDVRARLAASRARYGADGGTP